MTKFHIRSSKPINGFTTLISRVRGNCWILIEDGLDIEEMLFWMYSNKHYDLLKFIIANKNLAIFNNNKITIEDI